MLNKSRELLTLQAFEALRPAKMDFNIIRGLSASAIVIKYILLGRTKEKQR
jgi:hypothetical protein